MLLSLALMFLVGISLGEIFQKLKLPSLLGMLISGIILGPYALNLIDSSILDISAELRKIALIIILTRAGLNLDLNELKKVGRPAFLLCFLPALFEIVGMAIIAPLLFELTLVEAILMGCVVAAVSPAVIVPRMIKLMDEGYGTNKAIPQMIMAGASVDDVFVIVLFTSTLALAKGEKIKVMDFVNIPISIILGIIGGLVLGIILLKIFTIIHIRDSAKIIIIISLSFLLVVAEEYLTGKIGFSGLIAIMAVGICIKMKNETLAIRLAAKYSKLWVCAEIVLFVLVGAAVNIKYATSYGIKAGLLIIVVLLIRMIGVYICMLGTKLTTKERIFCMVSYCPKATVQAAIGAIPLGVGLACGELVLTVAVLAILITAPIGAIVIDSIYKKCLDVN